MCIRDSIGQDHLLICSNCGHGRNAELVPQGDGSNLSTEKCPSCGASSSYISKTKGIEVGHTFLLGQKYTKAFKASYIGPGGKPVLLEMGCYGLGVSRILAASLEVMSSDKEGLRWPDKIVPFSVVVLAPKVFLKEVQPLYNQN